MAAPVENYFLCIFYHVGQFNVDVKGSYTLDYIATLFRSSIYAKHCLSECAVQCTVVFLS